MKLFNSKLAVLDIYRPPPAKAANTNTRQSVPFFLFSMNKTYHPFSTIILIILRLLQMYERVGPRLGTGSPGRRVTN